MKFKFGNIIIRLYDNNRTAICLYNDTGYGEYPELFYLGTSFNDDGGLIRFDTYGMGFNSYKYRYANPEETTEILKELISIFNYRGNIEFNHKTTTSFKDLDELIKIVRKYNNLMRKEKLLKLLDVNNN